jgi:general secretion pathway protein H
VSNLQSSRGFTLIELMVVVLIIVIVLGMVSINLEPDRESVVRDEARRMALLLRTAQQESILQSKILAVEITPAGYVFLMLDNNSEFKPLSRDEILRPRELPRDITISAVNIEGSPVTEKPRLILLPTGELPEFTITFSLGDIRWQVQGAFSGEIKVAAVPLPGSA